MSIQVPFHVSPSGGSIICLESLAGRIYRACYSNNCTYTKSLYQAKSFINFIESKNTKLLPASISKINVSAQRKTTLKWNNDGSLSSIDMARILNRLQKQNLIECELSCEWNCWKLFVKKFSNHYYLENKNEEWFIS